MQFTKNLLLLLGVVLPFAATAPVAAPAAPPKETIPGKYIIVLKEGIAPAAVQAHTAWVTDLHKRSLEGRELDERAPAGLTKSYKIGKFAGYAGAFDEATIKEIEASDDVRYPYGTSISPCLI